MPLALVSVSVYRLTLDGRELVRVDVEASCPMCRGTRRVKFHGKARPCTVTCPLCRGAP